MRARILLLLVVITFLAKPFKGKAQVNVQDSLALVDLYNSTNGPGWTTNTNWLTKAPVSSWYGVYASSQRVTGIMLSANKLKGVLPLSLAQLTSLNSLAVDKNELIGTLPPFSSSLTQPLFLTAQYNALSGDLPETMKDLPEFSYIDLTYNRFNFTTMRFLAAMSKLKMYYLNYYQQQNLQLI